MVEAPADPPARSRRNTVADAIRRMAARHGRREALRYEDRTWSFLALDESANRVAQALLGWGLEPGDRVLALGRNSDAYYVAWLGMVKAGLVHVPVNYALTPEEAAILADQSGARAILSDPDLEPSLSRIRARGAIDLYGHFFGDRRELDILATALASAQAPAPEGPKSGETLAQILYTSGTTALPKGAALSHHALMAEYQSCIAALDFTGDDRALAALPLYHTAQMHAFTTPGLLAGGTVRLLRTPDPPAVLKLIEEERLTSFFAPPTVWISLLRHPDFARRDLSSLARLYYGATIMPIPVLEEIRARLPGARLYNVYGQSEIAPVATVLRSEEHETRPASAGRPVFNVETRVVDEAMKDCPPGVPGEIVHRSPQLMSGYWNDPAETANAFRGGWFHSGDIGYFDEAGYLFVVDRLKDIIKSGGVVVASREVEEVLYRHPAVSEVAVIGLPDPKWVEAVTAVVVLRDGHPPCEDALIRHARLSLAPFKVPKRIIFVEALARNSAGKVLKRELRRMAGG